MRLDRRFVTRPCPPIGCEGKEPHVHVNLRQPLTVRALIALARACVALRLLRVPVVGPWFARLAAAAVLSALRRWRKSMAA